ncbi:MAG TPA: hypothetical protein VNO54_10815 [Streptosporangiaceae bacterium]|nr:hypothetical protein [Streptosporangiaceae bacterium]
MRYVIPVALIHHWLLLHSPEEEHAVRTARLGQGQPTAERAPAPEVTVRTHRSMPAA